MRAGAAFLAGAPLNMAHRGGMALGPEHTLHTCREAVYRWGVDVLEVDVQPTLDGEAVVFHDSTLDRVTDASGPVVARTLEELATVDAGYRWQRQGQPGHPFRGAGLRVPTLRELLTELPGARVNIDIKDVRAQDEVAEVIEETRAEHRVLIAAERRSRRVRFRGSRLAVSATSGQLHTAYACHLMRLGSLYRPSVDAFQVPARRYGRRIVTPELIRDAHLQNIAVHVWTVNDAAEMGRLLRWGVDGIVTDRPDLLARMLYEEHGRAVPPGLREGPDE